MIDRLYEHKCSTDNCKTMSKGLWFSVTVAELHSPGLTSTGVAAAVMLSPLA